MPDKILHRRPHSGFVNYPKDFEKRIIDGTARFRTKCDVLIGPCACGGVHQENDGFVRSLLEENETSIEPINLTVSDDGKVYMPRYWYKPRGHERCNVLSGRCNCSVMHTANERWVVDILGLHEAKILGCPETELPTIETLSVAEESHPEFSGGCNCNVCRAVWERNTRRRNEI